MHDRTLLALAARVARIDLRDKRAHMHGCVAVRRDGVIVAARNGSAIAKTPSAHAEARVLRKAGQGSTVYVTHIRRDGQWRNSYPCGDCLALLRSKCVRRVVYTIGAGEWGVLSL